MRVENLRTFSAEEVIKILNEIQTEKRRELFFSKKWEVFERKYRPQIFKYDIVGRNVIENFSLDG